MATSKTAITPTTIHVWLASLGYLFPTTEAEVACFERLYADMVIPEEELLDPEVILGNKPGKQINRTGNIIKSNSFDNLRMAARNGNGNIPQHILNKMKNNHKKTNNGNDGTEEKKPD